MRTSVTPIKPRVVIDTNVFVSGVINPAGTPGSVLQALRKKRFTLVSSAAINDEITEVLDRPHIRDRYKIGDRIFDISFLIWEQAEIVTDPPSIKISSDPKDDKFLAAAIGGQADYLVTGDIGDLLHLHEYRGVTILSPKEFLTVLEL